MFIVVKKMAERSGEDLYDYLKKKWKGTEVKETATLPIPTSQEKSFTECAFSIHLPQRNPNFTGRDDLLQGLRTALTSGQTSAWKQVLSGLGGKGKSQIALEYGHRHRNDYQFIWWLPSEEPATLRANYASLATELDLPEKISSDLSATVAAVKHWLENNSSWLIIFDNALGPEQIEPYLPNSGKGNVIITSRNPNWSSLAQVIPVEVFIRNESIQFLLKRTGHSDAGRAGKLAEALGDLPLALEQAGAYMEETAISFDDYLSLFPEEKTNLLARGKPASYPDSVETTWDISFQEAQRIIPESGDLLRWLAFFAPNKIPRSQLQTCADDVPEPLSSALKGSMKFNDTVGALRRFSLIDATDEIISIHRLVQSVTLDKLEGEPKKVWAGAAVKAVNRLFPKDTDDVKAWPICNLWLPHANVTVKHAREADAALEETAQLLDSTGRYLIKVAEFQEAKENLRAALEIAEKVYGPEHPQVAIHAINLGSVLQDLGDLQGAKKFYERALAIDEKVYGLEHPNVAIDVNNLGGVLRDLGDLQGAKKFFERALAIGEKVYGPKHPKVAIRVNNLGRVLQDLGDLQGAKKFFERALAIDEKVYGPEHPDVAIDVNNLGGVLRDLGDLQGAKKFYERALAIDENIYGPEHPQVAIHAINLGSVLQDLGDLQGAKKFYE
ncbi:MAG: FxSxx-COOH system tetratricopeptide repeat protein, partial [Methanothrix sp.]|nr:FxSxx-COOH system tetratricopeptide repeat protein [Methanothrix sp.]